MRALFQLSDEQAVMFCNVQRASVYANDLELGRNLMMFDDLNAICSDKETTLIRGEQMDHPETGKRIILTDKGGPTGPSVGVDCVRWASIAARRSDGSKRVRPPGLTATGCPRATILRSLRSHTVRLQFASS